MGDQGASAAFASTGTGCEGLRLPACLVIMDGFGLDEPGPGNAIAQAATPVLDELLAERPHTTLDASGEAVGLPEGQMGNSEVGHLNIGAGRVVFQELTRINRACADGSLAANPVLQEAFAGVKERGTVLHLMGLLSDGGVHSSNEHLYALMEAAAAAGVPSVFVHCFLDGRDVPPKSAERYLRELQERMSSIEKRCGGATRLAIASMMGRYFAMDRDRRWDRVKRAYDAMVWDLDHLRMEDPVACLRESYDRGVTDEFVEPTSFEPRVMCDGDAVVLFNFRPDRARELTYALVDEDFTDFVRFVHPRLDVVCLTEYDPSIPAPVAFLKEFPGNVLADVLADAGLRQYHIAETEKYAHVTFFLNGGIEAEKAGEERALIASPRVATYDLQPEMSEPEVADTLVAAIDAGAADVYIVNFANCDMVGHTGVIPAAVAAVEAVDAGLGKVLAAMERAGGVTLVTADHGNADKMLADDGTPHTAHTTAPVPLVLVDATGADRRLEERRGKLADIAPTLLQLVGLPVPSEMTGTSLLA